MQLGEGAIRWIQDIAASASSTAWPSGATAGIAKESLSPAIAPGMGASRLHVAAKATAASGALTETIHLYGYATRGSFSSAPEWMYLGSMNSGSAMAVDTTKWSPNASTISVAEVFTVSADNYDRFATRSISPGGTTPSVSTWIGFAVA